MARICALAYTECCSNKGANDHIRARGERCPLNHTRRRCRSTRDDLLADWRSTLAALADIETRYEMERDHLESWSGPAEVKDHLLAELEHCHRASRERLALNLERLRQGRDLEPA